MKRQQAPFVLALATFALCLSCWSASACADIAVGRIAGYATGTYQTFHNDPNTGIPVYDTNLTFTHVPATLTFNYDDAGFSANTDISTATFDAPVSSVGAVFGTISGPKPADVSVSYSVSEHYFTGTASFSVHDPTGAMFNGSGGSLPSATGTASVNFSSFDGASETTVANVTFTAPTPEPSALSLAGLGALGLTPYAWRKRRRSVD
jgi:hypothetical protein